MQEKVKDITITAGGDFAASVLGWYTFYWLRYDIRLFGEFQSAQPASVLVPALLIGVFWVTLFSLYGMYRGLYMQGRFDEITRVFKISLLGVLLLFFLLFMDGLGWNASNLGSARGRTAAYWVVQFGWLSVFRILVRTRQKHRVLRGIGLHRAVLVGSGESARHVYESLNRNPIMGMRVIGIVCESDGCKPAWAGEVPVLGEISRLPELLSQHNVDEVIAAFEDNERERIVEVLDAVTLPDVKVKILPDFYQVVSGMNKTNQIFGLPFIDVMPDPMPEWEKVAKRAFDIVSSLIILIAGLPVWLLVGVLVRLTSEGPAIFRQKRVGLYGREFEMMKFRTMYKDAEKRTGPVWASDNDPRITPLGWWLRKLRLDEIPQLINVLKGEMSMVGPRPERPFFVDQFKKQIPLYSRRLRVKPGITGWAQVKWKYDASLEDVKEKTKYDLFYLENMSLRMDFKILLNTLLTVVTAKGK